MNPWQAALSAGLGFLTAWFLIPGIQKATLSASAQRGRQFHQTNAMPISRCGGAALAAAFGLLCIVLLGVFHFDGVPLATQWVVIGSSLSMFGLGFWDDLKPLGAKKKLLAQMAIATAVYLSGVKIELFKNPLTHTEYQLGQLSIFATVFWLVALTNLVNLIDGIDGLAGGICLMLMALLAYVSHRQPFCFFLATGMAGALLGFLYFNFPPAKIYLGDGGAYFLGFLIAILTLVSSNKGTVAAAMIAPLFALALPIADVTLAILRRGLRGLPIFRPDRQHIHHRLIATGLSKFKAVMILYSVSLIFLLLAFIVFWTEARMLPFIFGVGCLVFLGAAGSISFSREWFAVGRVVGNSLEMRKQTRFALLLSNWLLMEAERCPALEDLWEDYCFVVRKLGFSEVKLSLEGGASLKHTFAPQLSPAKTHAFRQELSAGNIKAVELYMAREMDQKVFDLLSELAAEVWMNALRRWEIFHGAQIRLEAGLEGEQPFAPISMRAAAG